MARVVVAGWVAQFPTAAFLWHAVSFALGFRELGHEVWFLEDPGDDPYGWDVVGNQEDCELRAGSRFLDEELRNLGLDGRWALRHPPTGRFDGMSEQETRDVLADADVFVNVSLTTPMRPEYRAVPHRLAVDTDPVFTQIRIAKGHALLAPVPETHTRLFSYGRPPLVAAQHEWVPTRQPVAAHLWPVAPPTAPTAPFSTVMAWRSYPPESWDGQEYAAKDRSFAPYLDLPRRTPVPLSVAIGGRGTSPELGGTLIAHGWRVESATETVTSTPSYRAYIARSAGEFSIAKHGYVAGRSGWFSERSCCYLAMGRPAVVERTGWEDWLPEGEGLLGFSSPDEATSALAAVDADPRRHAAAARSLVEEHFDAARVCAAILDAL